MLSYLNIINKAHYHNAEYSIITSFLEKQFYQGSSILDIGFLIFIKLVPPPLIFLFL